MLIVSYPSNPTAQWVDLDFYKDAIALAKKHDMLVLSDIAYSEIYFDDNPPPSILQVDGAKDIAVEVNSLSKTYAMAGWRVGMVVGNARICAALARVKSYLDYGAFTPIQVAAAAALNGPQDCVDEIRAIYKSPPRRAGRVHGAGRLGHSRRRRPRCSPGRRCPEPFKEAGSMLFSKLLIEEAGVAVAPGVGFGEYGEGYRAHRPGGERAPHPPGGAQREEVPRPVRRRSSAAPATPLAAAVMAHGGKTLAHRRRRPRHGRRRACSNFLAERPDFAPAGRPAVVTGVSARSRSRPRPVDISNLPWFDDPVALAASPDNDVFVELIGGSDGPAKAAVEAALKAGKPVVTANKALIAEHGAELAALAEANGVAAAVRGGGDGRHAGGEDAARGHGRRRGRGRSPASSTAPATTS